MRANSENEGRTFGCFYPGNWVDWSLKRWNRVECQQFFLSLVVPNGKRVDRWRDYCRIGITLSSWQCLNNQNFLLFSDTLLDSVWTVFGGKIDDLKIGLSWSKDHLLTEGGLDVGVGSIEKRVLLCSGLWGNAVLVQEAAGEVVLWICEGIFGLWLFLRNKEGSGVLLDFIDVEVSFEALAADIFQASKEDSHAASLVSLRKGINAFVFEGVNKGLLVIKSYSNNLSGRVERQRFDWLIALVENLCLLELEFIDWPQQPHKTFSSPHNKCIAMFWMNGQRSYFLSFSISNRRWVGLPGGAVIVKRDIVWAKRVKIAAILLVVPLVGRDMNGAAIEVMDVFAEVLFQHGRQSY